MEALPCAGRPGDGRLTTLSSSALRLLKEDNSLVW